jgi:hypothetical protein
MHLISRLHRGGFRLRKRDYSDSRGRKRDYSDSRGRKRDYSKHVYIPVILNALNEKII